MSHHTNKEVAPIVSCGNCLFHVKNSVTRSWNISFWSNFGHNFRPFFCFRWKLKHFTCHLTWSYSYILCHTLSSVTILALVNMRRPWMDNFLKNASLYFRSVWSTFIMDGCTFMDLKQSIHCHYTAWKRQDIFLI